MSSHADDMLAWLLDSGEIVRRDGHGPLFLEILHDRTCAGHRVCDCRPAVRHGTRVLSYGFYERQKAKEACDG